MVQFLFMAFIGVNLTLNSAALFATDYGAVLKTYAGIQRALASDKPEEAKKEAAELLKSLKNSQDSLSKRLHENTAALNKTTSDPELRSAFGKVSEVAVEMVRATDSLKPQWQLMYCPMVPKGTYGYWIQPAGEALQNPYYGAKMLTCGVKRPW